jgi:hypothetical protein
MLKNLFYYNTLCLNIKLYTILLILFVNKYMDELSKVILLKLN